MGLDTLPASAVTGLVLVDNSATVVLPLVLPLILPLVLPLVIPLFSDMVDCACRDVSPPDPSPAVVMSDSISSESFTLGWLAMESPPVMNGEVEVHQRLDVKVVGRTA